MENLPAQADNRGKIILPVGVALVVCVLLSCLGGYVAINRTSVPLVKNYFPTPTTTLIPIPHILITPPAENEPVLKDDFSTNHNEWSTYYSDARVEVKNGQLSVESYRGFGLAVCYCAAPLGNVFGGHYYLQADLTANLAGAPGYGLVFGLNADSDFYTFFIDPTKQQYWLDKRLGDNWVKLANAPSQTIKSSSEVNTLGVEFDHGTIKLYINGKLVATHKDASPLAAGQIGLLAAYSGFRLVVDNLFAFPINQ